MRDFTAGLLRELCHDMTTKRPLQPLTGERLHCQFCQAPRPGSLEHLRVWLLGRAVQESIFDVSVFNPSAPLIQQPQMSATYRKHEKEKRRHYERRVNKVEQSSFTPLVFSTTGGMGPSALIFYRRLADL